MKALRRVMRDPCTQCNGNTLGIPCSACDGRGFTRVRCGQCWSWQPVSKFIGCRALDTLAPQDRLPRAKLRGDAPLLVSFVLRSGNRKTGPIPVTMTSARTCPKTCALYGNGCYAEGHMTAMHWRRLSNGASGITWEEFCARVAMLPDGQVWRHNEAGDLPGDDGAIDAHRLAQLVLANGGKRGFTYTHKPVTPENADYIRGANQCGFVVNVSADDLASADDMADLGLPVVVTLSSGTGARAGKTPQGRTIVTCPAALHESITCESCKLCAVGSRKSIVGFPAHGDRKNQVTQRLRQLPMFPGVP